MLSETRPQIKTPGSGLARSGAGGFHPAANLTGISQLQAPII